MVRTLTQLALAAGLATCLGATAPATAETSALRPSDLNKNPEKYDHQIVVVEGILLINLPRNNHLKAIYDSKFRRRWVHLKSKMGFHYGEAHPDKGCVSIDNPKMIWDNIKDAKYKCVRIKGEFVAQTESPYELISGTCATGTGIWIEEILEVR